MKIIRQIGSFYSMLAQPCDRETASFYLSGKCDRNDTSFLCLFTGVLKIEHIQEKADFLLGNMAFFFVPAGVSIMNYFDVLKHSIVQLVFVCIISTIITFAVTAWSVKLTLRLMKSRKPENLQSGGGEK